VSPPASPPLDPDPIVQIHFNPSQIDLLPVNPWSSCSLALKFSGNQPAVHVSSKVYSRIYPFSSDEAPDFFQI
jgi:hypothetical protein